MDMGTGHKKPYAINLAPMNGVKPYKIDLKNKQKESLSVIFFFSCEPDRTNHLAYSTYIQGKYNSDNAGHHKTIISIFYSSQYHNILINNHID